MDSQCITSVSQLMMLPCASLMLSELRSIYQTHCGKPSFTKLLDFQCLHLLMSHLFWLLIEVNCLNVMVLLLWGRWMNGQHLRSLPPDVLIKNFEDRWKNTGILQKSENGFAKVAVELLKDGIDLITDADAALSNLLSYPLHATLSSDEAKPVVQDKLSEFALGLISAYDSGELCQALAEGCDGWQKWVKVFGKSLKRKGKLLYMPLRVLLTGKLHGPDMGGTIVLVHKAGTCGAVTPQSGFINLDERFRILKEVDWESMQNQQGSPAESAVPVAS